MKMNRHKIKRMEQNQENTQRLIADYYKYFRNRKKKRQRENISRISHLIL